MTINKDISTSNRILCPSLFTDSAPETATQSEGNYWDWQFYRTYRLEEEPNMLITKMPNSIQPTTVGVHARVKHQRQTQVFRCLCCVVREVTLLVAAVCWDHVCHMMCRVLLSCCGQPGDTNGCLSWEELKASTPCCSAEQSIIVCTRQVFFFQTSRVSAHLELGMFFTLTWGVSDEVQCNT